MRRCECCGTQERLLRITDGKGTRLLCTECAGSVPDRAMAAAVRFFGRLAMPSGVAWRRVPTGPVQEACPQCGWKLQDVESTGMLGCTACYDAFAGRLELVLPLMHEL